MGIHYSHMTAAAHMLIQALLQAKLSGDAVIAKLRSLDDTPSP